MVFHGTYYDIQGIAKYIRQMYSIKYIISLQLCVKLSHQSAFSHPSYCVKINSADKIYGNLEHSVVHLKILMENAVLYNLSIVINVQINIFVAFPTVDFG